MQEALAQLQATQEVVKEGDWVQSMLRVQKVLYIGMTILQPLNGKVTQNWGP